MHTQYIFVDYKTKGYYSSLYSTYSSGNWVAVSNQLSLPFNKIGKSLADYQNGGYYTINYMTQLTGLNSINPTFTFLSRSEDEDIAFSISNSNLSYGI